MPTVRNKNSGYNNNSMGKIIVKQSLLKVNFSKSLELCKNRIRQVLVLKDADRDH